MKRSAVRIRSGPQSDLRIDPRNWKFEFEVRIWKIDFPTSSIKIQILDSSIQHQIGRWFLVFRCASSAPKTKNERRNCEFDGEISPALQDYSFPPNLSSRLTPAMAGRGSKSDSWRVHRQKMSTFFGSLTSEEKNVFNLLIRPITDAWEILTEEGRIRRRYSSGRCHRPLIRRFPNGAIHPRKRVTLSKNSSHSVHKLQ